MRGRVDAGGGRVAVYDWLRLIATIFVVLGHGAYLNIQTTYGGAVYELPENLSHVYFWPVLVWWREIAGWVYGFHMPLFFMLSGAVLAIRPMGSFDQIFRAKTKRLLIPYFVYGWLFMLPVKRLGLFYDNASLIEAMRGFLSGEDSGHLWFLTALFWCMLVFVIIKKILDKMGVQSIYAVLLTAGAVQLLYTSIPFDILGLKSGLGYLFYFAVGYVFECERNTHDKWSIKTDLLAFAICLALEVINREYGILDKFFTIMTGSFMTYMAADICDGIFHGISENKVWKMIIRNLFYVYLFHDPMEYLVLRLFLGQGLLASGVGCIVYTLCRSFGVFAAAVFMGEIIRYLKKTGRKVKSL